MLLYVLSLFFRCFYNMSTFSHYVKQVRASGRQYFTVDDAVQDLSLSRRAVLLAVARLKRHGDLISPAKGLYVIVPPEYQRMGCIPAEELIPILMAYLKLPYYVSLLSAALYHGATHQKPRYFQIVTNKQMHRKLEFGQMHIQCLYKKNMDNLPIQNRTVNSGYLQIASPELTTLDLFLYSDKSGGINHIATVLSELIEVIDPNKLIALAERTHEKVWGQRLGYILEHIEADDEKKKDKLLSLLHNHVSHRNPVFMPLAPELPILGMPRCQKWQIIENTTVESDL
jgi:predicted transcriptional regulator of viral defense system